MDARIKRLAGIAFFLFVTMGASHRTPNFVVSTDDPRLARQIAEAAEQYRSQLSLSWLGESIPNWSSPCTMTVRIGENLGAGGATTFLFDRGEVYGWRMSIQGSRQRIFDSVLPHEITHMILASHFREPLPRWADEGAATSVECDSEKEKQYRSLQQFLTTGRGIPFNRMFAMTEYPSDIMPLYSQGFSLTEYLIRQGGRRKYINYLESAMENGNWAASLNEFYGVGSVGQLQNDWLAWVRSGRPELEAFAVDPVRVASHEQPLGGDRPTPGSLGSLASVGPDAVASAASTPHAMAEPIPVTIPPSGWRARDNQVASSEGIAAVPSDNSNPYAAAPIVSESNASISSSSPSSQGWVDPRSVASQANDLETLPAAEMVPIQQGPPLDPYAQRHGQTQMARPQPVQEASQIILEWQRR